MNIPLLFKFTAIGDIKIFEFDHVFDKYSTQEEVYKESISPMVENFIEGYNWAVFASGLSRAGKTYTLYGKDDSLKNEGIIPRTVNRIFEHIYDNEKWMLQVSYFMIYQEKALDLLAENDDIPDLDPLKPK